MENIVKKERKIALEKNRRYVKLKKLQEKIDKEIEEIENNIKVSVIKGIL